MTIDEAAFDVVIVGAGIAGILLALEMAHSRKTICIVETGAANPEEHYQRLNAMDVEGLDYDAMESRARAFGGSLHLWAGRCGTLDTIDFLERTWVSNSGWPINFSDLRDHYAKALNFLGKTGDMSPVLSPPVDVSTFGMERKYFLLFDHIDGSYINRVLRPLLQQCANIKLVEKTTVLRFISNSGSVVTHIECVRDGRTSGLDPVRIYGHTFVIAAGGLEAPRLLLNSSSLSASRNSNVGRYFTDHPRMKSSKFRLAEQGKFLAHTISHLGRDKRQLAYKLPDQRQIELRLLNHSFMVSQANRDIELVALAASDATAKRAPGIMRRVWRRLPPSLKRLVRALLAMRGKKDYRLVFKLELTPNAQSTITLSPSVDRHGMPIAVIDWNVIEDDREGLKRYFDLVKSEVDSSGYFDRPVEMPDPWLEKSYKDSSHPMGTLRMSASPDVGVVDANLKVFGCDNLYACGSAVFSTPGNANPTLTIAALAVRLACHLAPGTED